MKRKLTILTVLFLAATTFVQAQVGIGTTTPAASSALDVTSTTRGVLIPRMSSAQRTAITSPAEGLMVYQLNAPVGLWMFISGAWRHMSSSIEGSTYGPNTGFAANATANPLGTTLVVLSGTAVIPFPTAQNLGDSITVNGTNNTFTVITPGRYRIAYAINTTAGLLITSQCLINGTSNLALSFTPLVSASRYAAEAIVTLTANSTISVQLTGILGAVALSSGQGASLTIQRVQ